MGQAIRLSQFILTYGVGSIVESPRGPRIIPSIKHWDASINIFSGDADRIERIDNDNIKSQLDGNEVFQLPSNIDFDLHASKPLFRSFRFPSWALCKKHLILYKLETNGRSNCPSCKDIMQDFQDEAIRFIRACPKGHLDDVDWKYTIHRNYNCPGNTFEWKEYGGSDLKNIRLKCTYCNKDVKLSDIYNILQTCSGLFPEDNMSEKCDEKSSVILRNASSLRITEIVTAITIPEIKSNIHRLIKDSIARQFIEEAYDRADPKESLLSFIRGSKKINRKIVEEIEKAPNDQVNYAIKKIANIDSHKTPMDVKMEEFEYLKTSASEGYNETGSDVPKFEVDLSSVTKFEHGSGLKFRVTPIRRLTIVMAQKGYRRPVRGPTYKKQEDEHKVDLIETFFEKQHKKWYPGIELHGEGIFIDLPYGGPNLGDPSSEDMDDYEKDPIFVWWHSLSHRLIAGLSLDSGYSSSSIRERIYYSKRKIDDVTPVKTYGGILLYASQYGGDGTLGGLIALAGKDEISNVFAAAEKNLHTCSNDPLCSGNHSENNGAACYACLLISETSCERHNVNLDRNILIEGLMKKNG